MLPLSFAEYNREAYFLLDNARICLEKFSEQVKTKQAFLFEGDFWQLCDFVLFRS